MENNRTAGLLQKVTLLLFIVFLPVLNARGQDYKKYYKSQTKENNTLYFFPANTVFKSKDKKQTLVYDITFRTDWDSVIVNFSYLSKKAGAVDHLTISGNGTEIKEYTRKLFIEKEKKYWHNRYSISLSKDLFFSLFTSKTPLTINVCMKSDCDIMQTSDRDWKFHASIIEHVHQLILLNAN